MEDGKSLKSRLFYDLDFRIKFITSINIMKGFTNIIVGCYRRLFNDNESNKIFKLKIPFFSLSKLNLKCKFTLSNITIEEFMNGKTPVKITSEINSIDINKISKNDENIKDYINRYIINKKIPMNGFNEDNPLLKINQDNVLDFLLINRKYKKNLEEQIEPIINSNKDYFEKDLEQAKFSRRYFDGFLRKFIIFDNKDYFTYNKIKHPVVNIKIKNLLNKSDSEILNVLIVQKLFILNKHKMFNEFGWDKDTEISIKGEVFKLITIPWNHDIPLSKETKGNENSTHHYFDPKLGHTIYEDIYFSNSYYINTTRESTYGIHKYLKLDSFLRENKDQQPLYLTPPNKKLLYLMKI